MNLILLFYILVVITTLLFILSIHSLNENNIDSVFILLIGIFAIYIWFSPKLSDVLQTVSTPNKLLFISSYIIMAILIVFYVWFSASNYS